MLPDMYFVNQPGLGWGVFGHFNGSGGVITAINMLRFRISANLLENFGSRFQNNLTLINRNQYCIFVLFFTIFAGYREGKIGSRERSNS